MTESENTEELQSPPPPEPDRSWQTKLKRITPFLAGLAAFVVGLIWFAPLEAYTLLALRQLAASGYHVEVGELSISPFGSYKVESLKIPLAGDSDKQGILKIAEAKGRVALLSMLLGDKYDLTTEAVILSFAKGDFSLRIDSLEINSLLEQTKSGGTGKLLSGTINLEATSAQVTYKENRYLKEDIVVPFLKIVLKARAQQNQITIETGEAMGRLVTAQLRGSLSLGQQTELNLNLIIKPTEEFYQKYQDKDPKTLLRFANILQDDGRIELNIKGSIAQPVITPVTAQTSKTSPPAP
jgi:hypothetical protein